MPKQCLTITIFYIIKTILIYFYSLGFSLNARPHKWQLFNHYRVEIKVVVLYCMVLYCKTSKRGREILLLLVNEHFFLLLLFFLKFVLLSFLSFFFCKKKSGGHKGLVSTSPSFHKRSRLTRCNSDVNTCAPHERR